MGATWLALGSAVGVLVATALLAVLSSRLGGLPVRLASVLLPGGAGMLVAFCAWLTGLTGIPPVFSAPVVALGGFFAVLVTLPLRQTATSLATSTIFAVILTALLFAPAATVVFALWYDPYSTGVGYLDLGAALPTEIAAGSAVLAVLLVERRRPGSERHPLSGTAWSVLWPALGLWAGWIAWLVGLELAIDRLTPLILENALIMPVAAALARALVDRARHRSNSWAGVALGLLAGCAAATPAAGYLVPALAAVAALVAGAASGLLPRLATHPASLAVAGALVVGGGSSLLLLGFLAKDVGFIYTGQPEVFFGQALSVVLAGALGFVLALVVWSSLRLIRR